MYARLFADKCPLRPTAIQCIRSFCSQVPPPQTEVALVRLAPSGWLPLAGRLPLPGDDRPLSRSGPLVPGAAWRAPSSPQCGPHVLRDSRRSGATSETSEWTRKETGAYAFARSSQSGFGELETHASGAPSASWRDERAPLAKRSLPDPDSGKPKLWPQRD